MFTAARGVVPALGAPGLVSQHSCEHGFSTALLSSSVLGAAAYVSDLQWSQGESRQSR